VADLRGIFISAAALALWAVAGCANAQSLSPPQDPPGLDRLDLTASVEEVYDTNIARSDEAEAALRHLTQADELTQPAVIADVLRAFGQQSLFIKGLAGYDFYDHDTVLNSQRFDLEGGAELRAGPCQSVLSDEYAARQSDLSDITGPLVRSIRTTDNLSFSGDCARPIGLTPTLAASEIWSDSSAAQLRTTDYRAQTVLIGIAYLRPSLGRLSLYGQYESIQYPNRPIVVGSGTITDGSNVYAGGVRFEHAVGARIDITLHLSYLKLSETVPGSTGFGGANYGADVTVRPTGRITGTFHVGRDTLPSVQLGTSFSVDDSYRGEIAYQATSRLHFAVGGIYTDKHFSGPELLATTDVTHQQLTDWYLQAGIDFARRFSLVLDMRNEQGNSNLATFRYTSDRIGLTLTVHN
jgi:hypothetical protein